MNKINIPVVFEVVGLVALKQEWMNGQLDDVQAEVNT